MLTKELIHRCETTLSLTRLPHTVSSRPFARLKKITAATWLPDRALLLDMLAVNILVVQKKNSLLANLRLLHYLASDLLAGRAEATPICRDLIFASVLKCLSHPPPADRAAGFERRRLFRYMT